VKPALGLYVPFPETVVVPTAVPPLVQLVGAAACGPNTVKVIVPVAPLVAPDRFELIELETMAVPAAPPAGAAAVVAVAFLTSVELMPEPQVLVDAALLLSPP
jgi:hypothetical protein